jgi:tetratricopeptide (TPR) repeat protein
MGNALVGLKEFKRAISHYTEALRFEPDHADVHNNLGVALANLGRIEEAIIHFSEAVRIKPEYESARRNLKQALQFRNTSVEASGASLNP